MDKKKKVLIPALAVAVIGFAVFLILFLTSSSGEKDIKQMKQELTSVEGSYIDESDVKFCYSLYKGTKENGKKLIAFRNMKIYGELRIYDVAYESERYVVLAHMTEEGGNVFKYTKYSTTSERASAISDYIRQLDSNYNSMLEQARKTASDF